MTIVDQLLEYKKQRGLKNQEIADLIGVTDSTVRNWFKGRTAIPETKRRLILRIIQK